MRFGPLWICRGVLIPVTVLVVASCGNAAPSNTVPATTEVPNEVIYTVTVTVHAGPSCPVEQPDKPCPDVPVRGTVYVHLAGSPDGEAQASGPTDAAGVFRAELLEGAYEVSVDTGAPLPRCEPVVIEVVDRNLDVDVSCDSGIR